MRTYRAKASEDTEHANKGEWVEGYPVECQTGDLFGVIGAMGIIGTTYAGNNFYVLVDRETICQQTGLIDINEKEIYHNDVISQSNFNGEEYKAVYIVVWDNGGYCLKMIKGNEKAMNIGGLFSFGHIENNKLRKGEVIGNIFDNPELAL